MLKRVLWKSPGRRAPAWRGSACMVAAVAVMATLCTGCWPWPRANYAQFAKAGTAYVAALDPLLIAAGNVRVNATSEKLLADRAIGKVEVKDCEEARASDQMILTALDGLRAHARLLAGYFQAIDDLASTDAPTRAKEAMQGVVNSLQEFGGKLRECPLLPQLPQITEIVVDARIRAALSKELKAREKTIRTELITQELLLESLSKRIAEHLKVSREAQNTRLVVRPLTSDNAEWVKDNDKCNQWVADRRSILRAETTVGELARASKSMKAVREAFEDLVSGKLTLARIRALLDDINTFLAVVQAIHQQSGGNS